MAKDDPDAILYQMYSRTLDVLQKAIGAGAANNPLSIIALDAYFDLLHGGALRPSALFGGNNSIPSILHKLPSSGSPTTDPNQVGYIGSENISPYYTGVNWNNYEITIFDVSGLPIIPQFGTADVQDVLSNVNVPTIFPKLLSDQFMARWLIFRSQNLTEILVSNTITGVGTGLKTFVEAATGIAGIPGQLAAPGIEQMNAESAAQRAQNSALIAANSTATTGAVDNGED